MRVGSLFAGIAGFDEGLRRAGMHSVWQVEKEPFCLRVLKTRFPNAQRAEDILTCRGLTSSVPASHARIGRSRDRERDCAASVARSFTSLRESCTSFDPLGSSSRMFPDFSVVTTEETLRKSSGFSWSSAGMGFNGVCLTASFSESPSAAVVCSLSDVLESHAPPRFFLSAKAAKGILRRTQKRGRTLPTRLQKALEELAARDATTARISPSDGPTPLAEPCASMNQLPIRSKAAQTDTRQSYWDDTQQTDTLDCSMLAKGQIMPEKRRFACVLTPAGSDRDTTQPTPSPKTCETGVRDQPNTYLAAILSTKNEPANSAATREEMMNTMATLTMSVRRLTPTECEILQGFPKGWTLPDTELLGTQLPST
jgi:site-specific DNA-cytosine methylase